MKRAGFLSFVLLMVRAGLPSACECPEPPPAASAKAYVISTVIFMGTVEERRIVEPPSHGGYLEFRFRVLEDWKGAPSDTILIGTSPGGGMCGYPFEVGRTYVVYAWHADGYRYEFTSICDRTSVARYALADLMVLGEGTPRSGYSIPKPPTRASLIDSLRSEDVGMRASAATALGYCDEGPSEVVHTLAATALSGVDGDGAAAAALGRFGRRGSNRALAEPVLRTVLEEARPDAQACALRSMYGLVDERAFYELVERALREGRGWYQHSAILYARRPGEPPAVRARVGHQLLVLTKHPDPDVRRDALEATREYLELRSEARKRASTMARKDPDEWVRQCAEEYLQSTALTGRSTPPGGR